MEKNRDVIQIVKSLLEAVFVTSYLTIKNLTSIILFGWLILLFKGNYKNFISTVVSYLPGPLSNEAVFNGSIGFLLLLAVLLILLLSIIIIYHTASREGLERLVSYILYIFFAILTAVAFVIGSTFFSSTIYDKPSFIPVLAFFTSIVELIVESMVYKYIQKQKRGGKRKRHQEGDENENDIDSTIILSGNAIIFLIFLIFIVFFNIFVGLKVIFYDELLLPSFSAYSPQESKVKVLNKNFTINCSSLSKAAFPHREYILKGAPLECSSSSPVEKVIILRDGKEFEISARGDNTRVIYPIPENVEGVVLLLHSSTKNTNASEYERLEFYPRLTQEKFLSYSQLALKGTYLAIVSSITMIFWLVRKLFDTREKV